VAVARRAVERTYDRPMALRTRLTERMELEHPVVLAPMAFAAGGRLAAAVSEAGGLGLIGGGYGNAGWVDEQFDAAAGAAVGCGFITWSLEPAVLDDVLQRRPRAILLSFGDPRRFAPQVRAAGVPLLCQVQTRADAELALDAGADVIVAQGAEAGGHGDRRGTFTLVPELADLIAARAPETLLCAAGGIADGRGLAAALTLGADGVLVGSRLWATGEAEVPEAMHAAALAATGDDTVRTSVMDIARGLDWPERFTARVLRNRFTEDWHGREAELRASPDAGSAWSAGWSAGDPERANTFVGEAVGLIGAIEPAGHVIERMVDEAATLLRASGDGAAR
jgi:nitronate monooxygenase